MNLPSSSRGFDFPIPHHAPKYKRYSVDYICVGIKESPIFLYHLLAPTFGRLRVGRLCVDAIESLTSLHHLFIALSVNRVSGFALNEVLLVRIQAGQPTMVG